MSKKDFICSYCNRIVEVEKRKPNACPHCGQKGDFGKPVTEHKLFELQAKFLETRDVEVLGDMVGILASYSRSLILSGIRSKKYTINPDSLDEIAMNSAIRLVDPYMFDSKTKEGDFWNVGKSFAGTLHWKIIEEINESNIVTKHASLNDIVEGTDKEILELAGAEDMKNAWVSNEPSISFKEDIVNELMEVLETTRKLLLSRGKSYYSIYIAIVQTTLVLLRKGTISKDKCLESYPRDTQKYIELVLLQMKQKSKEVQTRGDDEK